jgi:hypothetical protein
VATNKKNEKPPNGDRAVLVTTEHRGVFFGYGEVQRDGDKLCATKREFIAEIPWKAKP